MTRLIDSVLRPLYNQLYEIVGALIGLPADDEQTHLCAHSIMGQIIIYALAGPVLARLWPDMKMTPENLDRIADHVTDFSLAYLRQARGIQQLAAKAAGRRNLRMKLVITDTNGEQLTIATNGDKDERQTNNLTPAADGAKQTAQPQKPGRNQLRPPTVTRRPTRSLKNRLRLPTAPSRPRRSLRNQLPPPTVI
jgi:hypothetical protein